MNLRIVKYKKQLSVPLECRNAHVSAPRQAESVCMDSKPAPVRKSSTFGDFRGIGCCQLSFYHADGVQFLLPAHQIRTDFSLPRQYLYRRNGFPPPRRTYFSFPRTTCRSFRSFITSSQVNAFIAPFFWNTCARLRGRRSRRTLRFPCISPHSCRNPWLPELPPAPLPWP